MDIKPQKNSFIRYASFGNRHFLLNGRQSFEIDQIGLEIWAMCDGKNTVDNIVDKIHEEYQVNREQVKKDINEFIEKALDKELLIGSFGK